MNIAEERLQKALEQLQSGRLPETFADELPTGEAELLHLASTLAEIRPPARDPQIVAAQRRALLNAAAGKTKRSRPSFRINFSWPAVAFVGVLLLLFVGGFSLAGRWLLPERPVTTDTARAPSTDDPALQPNQEPDPADAFIAIEPILAEIDREVCREALAARGEIEALLAQGEDMVELETAVNELIVEFGNCRQTQLNSKNPVSSRSQKPGF